MTTLEHVYIHLRIKFNFTASYVTFRALFLYYVENPHTINDDIVGAMYKEAIKVYPTLSKERKDLLDQYYQETKLNFTY